MSDQKDRKITFPKGSMLEDLTLRIKLILRLMGDSRVSIFLKALPVVTLVYLIIPDLVLGPFDDVAVIWLGAYLFVELCPPDVVQEHINHLRTVVPGEWRDANVAETTKQQKIFTDNMGFSDKSSKENGSIVDAEYWDTKNE